jgi:hypothetical protein
MTEHYIKKAIAKGFSKRINVSDYNEYEAKVDKFRLLKAAEHRNRDLDIEK